MTTRSGGEQCSATLQRNTWREKRCKATGRVEREGAWYCMRHDPVTIEARMRQRSKTIQRDEVARIARWRLQDAVARQRDDLVAEAIVMYERDAFPYSAPISSACIRLLDARDALAAHDALCPPSTEDDPS